MSSNPSAKGDRRSVRVGKYEVLARLKTDALGTLCRARDPDRGRDVALRILPPELAARPAVLERIVKGVRRAARLHHENVVAFHEAGKDHGTAFLVLEFVEGLDLGEHVAQHGPLAPDEAFALIVQAAQALHYAHQQGVVHGALRPGNTLLARKGGRPLVKLAGFGYAAEADDAGPGRAPELAQGRPADARTDIYALGCLLFYLLTGRAYGSADLSQVPGSLGKTQLAILRRLLADKPEDRYPSAAALLQEVAPQAAAPVKREPEEFARLLPDDGGPSGYGLAQPEKAEEDDLTPALADADLSALADVEEEAQPEEPPPAKGPSSMPPRNVRRQMEDDEPESDKGKGFRLTTPVVAGIAGGVALLAGAIAVAVMALGSGSGNDDHGGSGGQVRNLGPTVPPAGGPAKDGAPASDPGKKADGVGADPQKAADAAKQPAGPKPPPALYKPAKPVDWQSVYKEFQGPWTSVPSLPADTPIFRVSRSPLPAGGADAPRTFDSLAKAAAAAPEGKLTLIEIHDNGPLFEAPVAVAGRSLAIGGGGGFRPLIVWDTQAGKEKKDDKEKKDAPNPRAEGPALLAVTGGKLMLAGIDLAVKWSDAAPAPPALVRVADGELFATGCTFSVAAKFRTPLVAVRFESGAGKEPKCRLNNCYARGSNLVALDVKAPAADVMLDNCVLAGGEMPLLQVAGAKDKAPTLRVVRTTLVANQTLLELRADGGDAAAPGLRWLGWDALVARPGWDPGGVLLALPPEATTASVSWKAVNSLYAGWKTLASGREPISAADMNAWRNRWQLPEGDVAIPDQWSAVTANENAEVSRYGYYTENTPFWFQATFGAGLLGCHLNDLPPGRDQWLALAYDRFTLPKVDVYAPDAPPPVPAHNDGKYYGGRLDLSKNELGAFLRDLQKKQKLGNMVVMHLHGSGKHKLTPIALPKRTSLILYFEPPAQGAAPLVLEPHQSEGSQLDAVIHIQTGNLYVIGGQFECPDFKTALVPHYLFAVTEGNLWLHRCRLKGPLANPPDAYWGLVRIQGSGFTDPDKVYGMTINDTVLQTAQIGIHVVGTGARLRLNESAIVAGGEALRFEPGPQPPARLNVQCQLEHMTLAGRRGVVFLGDSALLPVPAEPILIQSKQCAFLNPFPAAGDAKEPSPALLMYENAALRRGLLSWHGDGDFYDKRFRSFLVGVQQDGKPLAPEQLLPFAGWARLWGPAGDRQPVTDLASKGTMTMEKVQLEALELQPRPGNKDRPAGADLAQLGIVKKAR